MAARRIFSSRRSAIVVIAVLVVSGFAALLSVQTATEDGSESHDLARGAAIYAEACAACHGANLEGQPNWRSPLPTGRLPAPPHDASGHTWHHPDDVLFRIVKEGTAAIVGGGYESDMPGFGGVLSDAEIRAVLEYIKSTWPEREQSYQEKVSRAD